MNAKILKSLFKCFLAIGLISCQDDFFIDSRLNNHTLIFKYHQSGLVNPTIEFDYIDILDFKDGEVSRYHGFQEDWICNKKPDKKLSNI